MDAPSRYPSSPSPCLTPKSPRTLAPCWAVPQLPVTEPHALSFPFTCLSPWLVFSWSYQMSGLLQPYHLSRVSLFSADCTAAH